MKMSSPDILSRCKFPLFALFIQMSILVLFIDFCDYSLESSATDLRNSLHPVFGGFSKSTPNTMFQDVHVMIFIGFGFLMTFLKKYGYSAVGFNFLLGALTVQWAILCQGFSQLNENNKIEIGIENLFKADIAAAAVPISMGAVLGRTSYIQLLIMGIVEIAVFSGNEVLGTRVFQVADAGGSVFVHAFGAYFGLAVSYMTNLKASSCDNPLEASRYTSDIFAMIGTIFLWIFWPSFNAIGLDGDQQQRAITNTYLSLASSCVTTFAFSVMLSENHKFDMVHIQNSTLAGGVAVGACANLMLQPWGALITGVIAATISVFGYTKITGLLKEHLGVLDTCGVHNLHGLPGVLSGFIGAFMAGIATESIYNKTLYEIYPARACFNLTATPEYTFLKPGLERTAVEQALYQILALVVTLTVATVAGLITGMIMKKNSATGEGTWFNDISAWQLPKNGFAIGGGALVSFNPLVKNIPELF